MVDLPVALSPGRPLAIFTPFQEFYPSEQIEDHLPEEGIDDILDIVQKKIFCE